MLAQLRIPLALVVAFQVATTPPPSTVPVAETPHAAITFRTTDPRSGIDLAARIDAAMAQGHRKVVVNFSPYTKTLPEPVAVWVRRVKDTGGEVYVRSLAKNAIVARILAILLPAVGRILKAALDKWLGGLGDPARNYNAMIVTNTLGGANPDCFVRVEFYLRKGSDWADEKALGVPLDQTTVDLKGTAADATAACPPPQ